MYDVYILTSNNYLNKYVLLHTTACTLTIYTNTYMYVSISYSKYIYGSGLLYHSGSATIQLWSKNLSMELDKKYIFLSVINKGRVTKK